MKKLFALTLAAFMALSLSHALAGDMPRTEAEMVAWALQDEADAEASYLAILKAFGNGLRPFANIARAERAHQALLRPLMEKYGLAAPEAAPVSLPAGEAEAYQAGIEAEEKNIAMYRLFLARENLPENMKAVFERLLAASENHLAAFTRAAGRGSQGAQGRGPGRQKQAQPACPACSGCPAADKP